VILDGAILHDNNATATSGNTAGGVVLGGGNYGAYFVMNSGKITNNKMTYNTTTGNGSAGGVFMYQYGMMVMHGGEISNNETNASQTASSIRAGGIGILSYATNTANYHGTATIFMTGGEIFGNKVLGTGATTSNGVASAGGVITNGTFMKTGGTIYGSDNADVSKRNSTAFTGAVRPNAVGVIMSATYTPNASQAKVRENDTGPWDTLFVDSYKSSNILAGTNTVPTWAESFWD
jgi:hypothetical protein